MMVVMNSEEHDGGHSIGLDGDLGNRELGVVGGVKGAVVGDGERGMLIKVGGGSLDGGDCNGDGETTRTQQNTLRGEQIRWRSLGLSLLTSGDRLGSRCLNLPPSSGDLGFARTQANTPRMVMGETVKMMRRGR
ncbi:hypothetical protein E3N88_39917 [Mikania micrantha]|uniref:Uncharacterized protein n=1 Tax=Mikania micrantha TaxID=192012 RepID=A0A5N6LL54_9ASTR|nr:hypothetical protein E3N88_39917 [Mikania micrantha]